MSRHHGPQTVMDGLALYLDAGNPKSYPGTGTLWKDLSGNGNHGTLMMGPTSTPSSIVFDGVDDYVTLGTRPSLSFTEEETVIWWCRPTNIDMDRRAHVGARRSGFLTIYGSQLGYESTNHLGLWQNNLYTASGVVQNNTWQQFCFTFIANGPIVLYRNGIKVGEKTAVGSQAVASAEYLIGTEAFGGWGTPMYFMGDISIVQNYSRSLSASEIKQNFSAVRGRYGI